MTDEKTPEQPEEETGAPVVDTAGATYPGQSLVGADRPTLTLPTEEEAKQAKADVAKAKRASK